MHKMSMIISRENSQKTANRNDAPGRISVCEIHFAPAKKQGSGRHVARTARAISRTTWRMLATPAAPPTLYE